MTPTEAAWTMHPMAIVHDLARQRLSKDAGTARCGAVATGPGDDDLNPGALAHIDWQGRNQTLPQAKPAAVLIGLVDGDGQWACDADRRQAFSPLGPVGDLEVIFTRRTAHLPSHAGQISFPGGKIDAGDDGPADSALREAHEEIGLPPGDVEPLGFIDAYRTGTGFVVYPLVGLVAKGFVPQANPAEVAEVFTVPLGVLMDANNMQLHETTIDGRQRQFHAITYRGRFIWGATAGMLKNLRERLFLK